MGLVWHVFNGVAEDLGELEAGNLDFAARSSYYNLAHRRVEDLFSAVLLTSFQSLFGSASLGDISDSNREKLLLARLRVGYRGLNGEFLAICAQTPQ